MDGKKTQTPPFPGQKLLAAPKLEIAKQALQNAKQDFLDFGHDGSSPVQRMVGWLVLILVLVAGFYILSPAVIKIVNSQDDLVGGYIPVSSIPKSMDMEIQTPDDELLVFNNTVVVSGKTTPKSSVIIIDGQTKVGTEADGDGNFQKVVDLQPGINLLNIQAFDPEGNSKADTRTVYYSEETL